MFDTSDTIRDRIRRYHDHGIGVEGTVLLGLDDHTEDGIRRLIDFLLEIELDLAEFTVLAPFPHTRAFEELHAQKRILSYDWDDYTADKVVFHPRHMSAQKLQELLDSAWDLFYRDEPQKFKMFKLLQAGGQERTGRRHLPAPPPGNGRPGVRKTDGPGAEKQRRSR